MQATTAEVGAREKGTPGLTGWRWAIFAGASALLMLAVSGLLVSGLFTQPSTVKYVATVLGCLLVALVATVRAPLRVLVGIALVVAPFDFVKTYQGIPITPLLAIDVLAVLVWLPRARVGGRPALKAMTVVFVLCLIPAIVGSNGAGSWTLWLAVTLATGYLTYVVACEPGGVTFVASMLALSALIQGALAIWEKRSGFHLNLYQAPTAAYGDQYFFAYGATYDRPPGAAPDPIALGQILALCIPMMVALAVSLRRLRASFAVLAAAGVASVALLLSLSRMSTIGGAIGLAVTVCLLPWGTLRSRGPALLAMVAAIAVVGTGLGGRALTERIDSIFHPTAAHTSTAPGDITRERIWRAAIKTGEANFVTGVGFGNVTKFLPKYGVPVASDAHSHDTYLQYFAEGGVLALLGLLGILGAGALDLLRSFRSNRIWVAGATGALVATMLSWLTDVEVRYTQVSAMVAALLGLIAALAAKQRAAADEGALALADPVAPLLQAPGPEAEDVTIPGMAEDAPTLELPTVRATSQLAPVTAPVTAAGAALASTREHVPARYEAEPAPILLVIIPSLENASAEQFVGVVSEAAAAHGWEVHAAIPRGSAAPALREELFAAGVHCHPLPFGLSRAEQLRPGVVRAAVEAWRTALLLRRVRANAVLVALSHPDEAPGSLLAAALYPARAVTSVHLVPEQLQMSEASRIFYTVCRRLGQRLVAVSTEDRRALAKALGWPEEAVGLVHESVADELTDDLRDRSEIRQQVQREMGSPDRNGDDEVP